MPSEISMGTAIDIALKSQLMTDQLGCPEGVRFDAKPEEVYQTLQLLATFAKEHYVPPTTYSPGHYAARLF